MLYFVSQLKELKEFGEILLNYSQRISAEHEFRLNFVIQVATFDDLQ